MKQKINIEGMTCNGCVENVKRVLHKQAGIKNADVNLAGYAEVDFDETEINSDKICNVINKAGFSAKI